MYKNWLFVNMIVIVWLERYVLSVFGLYRVDGKNKDVFFIKYMFKFNVKNFVKWIFDDDVCIVDWGFWDFVDFLKSYGL